MCGARIPHAAKLDNAEEETANDPKRNDILKRNDFVASLLEIVCPLIVLVVVPMVSRVQSVSTSLHTPGRQRSAKTREACR